MKAESALSHCIEKLISKGFRCYEVPTGADALALFRLLMDEINPATVSFGGSLTLKEIGILDELRNRKDVELIDGFQAHMSREEKWEIRRRGVTAELFLSGVNAVSEDGSLHWLDMVGNRVAPIAFGPKQVILIVGKNKIVSSKEAAMERMRSIAPQNAKLHGFQTPCATTGVCVNCNSPEKLCNVQMSISRCYPQGRIIVIFIAEELGL